MTRWTVIFQDTPEMTRIRADKARRLAHIAYVRASPELQIGGVMAMRPMQDFPGAIWTVEAVSRDEVETLVKADPYYITSFRRFYIQNKDQTSARQDRVT